MKKQTASNNTTASKEDILYCKAMLDIAKSIEQEQLLIQENGECYNSCKSSLEHYRHIKYNQLNRKLELTLDECIKKFSEGYVIPDKILSLKERTKKSQSKLADVNDILYMSAQKSYTQSAFDTYLATSRMPYQAFFCIIIETSLQLLSTLNPREATLLQKLYIVPEKKSLNELLEELGLKKDAYYRTLKSGITDLAAIMYFPPRVSYMIGDCDVSISRKLNEEFVKIGESLSEVKKLMLQKELDECEAKHNKEKE